MKTIKHWIAGASLAAAVGQSGCQSQTDRPAAQIKPIFMVLTIDVSDSGAEADKLGYGQLAMSFIRTLDPSRDRLLVLRFDGETTEIGSEVPTDIDGYTFVLRDAILKPSKVADTRPAVMLEALTTTLSAYDTRGYDLQVKVLTDGGNDDRSSRMENLYRKAVSKLTALPGLSSLDFWGVRDGLREDIRGRFRVLDSQGKLRIYGPGERGG